MNKGAARNSVGIAALIAAWPAFAATPAATAPASINTPVVAAVAAAAEPPAPRQRINTTGKAIVITVPMRASGPLGQVQITIAPDDSLSVSAEDFTNALTQIVKPDEIARIKALAGPAGQLSAAQAATLGYKLSYDSENVELVVNFDTALLATRSIDIIAPGTYTAVQPDRSAGFAAYLNYRVGEILQVTGPRKGQADFLGDFELGGRISQAIGFDNFATVDPRADHTFVRTSSRIFYDIPGPSLRLTAGDLFTETAGFQADPQISGLNISHLIDTFYPGAPVSGTSSRNLVLNRDADVQILVNGIPVSQIHLGPGSYDLRNLPVAQGANNLQAVITDSSGERRVQNFSFFQSAQLLSPGISEYTLSAGVLAPLGDNGPDYTNKPAVSGFYRRGINDQLTLGVNAQAAKYDQVFGVDATFGSSIGLFSGSIAANHVNTGQGGAAARLQYSYADKTNTVTFARSFDLFVEYDSKYFTSLTSFSRSNLVTLPGAGAIVVPLPIGAFDLANVNTNSQALLVTANLNQPLTRALVLQLSGTYSHGRDGFGDRGSLSALITYQAPFRTTLGVGVTYQWAPRDTNPNFLTGRGFSFLATLTHRFGPHATLSASADRFNQRVSFSRSPTRPVDDYFINADASHNRFGTSANATAGYETNRGDIEATYSTALDRGGGIVSQQVGAFFNGSLVIADGRVGVGRRITDAFAVIGKDASLGDRQVIIESRFANQVVARSGTFGPAVVPISSYQRALV
ncbi:MAG: fimbria/pilus outer membrane usher protein, partial [Pseudomonadota bacterium]|nr:fimbria/pilus outer membrane usher protein [Pseudomonadota bacterium]